tara:strand:+ start:2896 stop:3423 length:528 start_codon:yes stop_codon:yes gene_type:complete
MRLKTNTEHKGAYLMLGQLQRYLNKELKGLGVIILLFGIVALIYSLTKAHDIASIAGSRSGAIYLTAAMPGLAIILVGAIATVVGSTAETTERMEQKISEIEALIRGNVSNLAVASTGRDTFQGTTTKNSVAKKSSDRVKVFKGYEILKTEAGVSVAGKDFDGLLAAEKWINEQK